MAARVEVEVADQGLFQRARRALDAWQQDGGGSTSAILGNGAIAVLEQRLAARMGVAHGLALPSATMALRVALQALAVEPGDEVIVPAYDWIAAAAATRSLQAVPVAADITLPHCTVSSETVGPVIGSRTRAVVVTHLLGVPADVREIRRLCDPLGIPVIEDCAQALGARIDGQPVGALGAAAAVSFGPGKPVDGGGGGMLLTDNPASWRRAVELSQHPARQLLAGVPPNLAVLESRIHPLAALVALASLEWLDGRLAARRRCIEQVRGLVAGVPGVEAPGDLDRRYCVGPGLPVHLLDQSQARELQARGLELRPLGQQLVAGELAVRCGPTPAADHAGQEAIRLAVVLPG
jgi:dTDP-4-amino-4,6-dideoxygalactose transaminase